MATCSGTDRFHQRSFHFRSDYALIASDGSTHQLPHTFQKEPRGNWPSAGPRWEPCPTSASIDNPFLEPLPAQQHRGTVQLGMGMAFLAPEHMVADTAEPCFGCSTRTGADSGVIDLNPACRCQSTVEYSDIELLACYRWLHWGSNHFLLAYPYPCRCHRRRIADSLPEHSTCTGWEWAR